MPNNDVDGEEFEGVDKDNMVSEDGEEAEDKRRTSPLTLNVCALTCRPSKTPESPQKRKTLAVISNSLRTMLSLSISREVASLVLLPWYTSLPST